MKGFKILIVTLVFLAIAFFALPYLVGPITHKILYEDERMPEDVQARKIEEYSGNKLLLCAGHHNRAGYWQANEWKSNEEWYTVNDDPKMEPDYLANLLVPESYSYFPLNKFALVVDEYCPYEVSNSIRIHIAPSIKKGGMLVSKYCGQYQDLPKIKKGLRDSGFSTAIISAEPKITTKDAYWVKKTSIKTILELYKANEVKQPIDATPCMEGQWYEFIAIK